jgi:hypothetical protein
VQTHAGLCATLQSWAAGKLVFLQSRAPEENVVTVKQALFNSHLLDTFATDKKDLGNGTLASIVKLGADIAAARYFCLNFFHFYRF